MTTICTDDGTEQFIDLDNGQLNYEEGNGNCPANWTVIEESSPAPLVAFLLIMTI